MGRTSKRTVDFELQRGQDSDSAEALRAGDRGADASHACCPCEDPVGSCIEPEQEGTPETLVSKENVPEEINGREEVVRLESW